MRKILITLLFLVTFLPSSHSNENIYCFEPGFSSNVSNSLFNRPKVFMQKKNENTNPKYRCLSAGWSWIPGESPIEIPQDIYIRINNINEPFLKRNENAANEFKTILGNFDRPRYDQLLIDWRNALNNAYSESKSQIDDFNRKREASLGKIEISKTSETLTHDSRMKIVFECEKRYLRFSDEFNKCFQDFVSNNSKEEKSATRNNQITLSKKSEIKLNESKFSKKCEGGLFASGYKKGTTEFNDCLKREEKLAALDDQKQKLKNEEKNNKIALEQDKKQRIIDDKKSTENLKAKELNDKLAKMNPDDRRAYTCTEKFGFRKGSDKFKDCIFELYKAETELEKLELQKQVAKANADAARANAEAARAGAERQERLALAQTEAAKMQALAARQQAIAANTADSLALIESGLRMMSPQRPAVAPMRTCTYNRNFMNCF